MKAIQILQAVGMVFLSLLMPATNDWPPFLDREGSGEREAPLQTLKKIYDEVKELGNYPGEDFIKREFFIGRGDDDTNKDLHIVILIQSLEVGETMKIQVTFMETTKDNPNVRYAKTVKNIVCTIIEKKLTVQGSDYDRNQLEKLVPDLLQTIRDKKKLLQLIKNGGASNLGIRPGSGPSSLMQSGDLAFPPPSPFRVIETAEKSPPESFKTAIAIPGRQYKLVSVKMDD